MTAGGAAATLVGLLFVDLSLHIRVVVSHADVRSLARVTLTDFFVVLLVALLIVAPIGAQRLKKRSRNRRKVPCRGDFLELTPGERVTACSTRAWFVQPMSIAWFALLVLVASVAPAAAFAHVKWFTDPASYPLRADLVLSPSTFLWLGASAVVLLWMSLIQRVVGGADWPRLRLWNHLAAGGPTQLAVLAAIGLVSAAVRRALFAPNLSLPSGPVGLGVACIELVVAATFVTGVADWIGAVLLLTLVPIGVALFSPLELAEQLHWVGLAGVVLLVGRRASDGSTGRRSIEHRDPACAGRALALLRILTGVAIIAAACEEKLWNPALGRAFLADHPLFNVLHGLFGLPITDDTFALLVGAAEGVIGVLLVSGLMTRVVVLGMWLPFNLGIPFLPPQELLGHLPIFGAMYLLLAHGPGVLYDWRHLMSWKTRPAAALGGLSGEPALGPGASVCAGG